MRDHHAPIRGNCAYCAHQLNRRDGDCALADTNRNCFAGKPLLLKIADLPLFRRHDAGHFIGKVDTGLLSQSKGGCVFRYAIDAKFFGKRVKEDIARLINRLCKIDLAMPATSASPDQPYADDRVARFIREHLVPVKVLVRSRPNVRLVADMDPEWNFGAKLL